MNAPEPVTASEAVEKGGTPLGLTGYLVAEGHEAELETELGDVAWRVGRALFAPGAPRPAAWAANIWFDPLRIPICSIGDGAAKLRAIQRNWALCPGEFHRRAALIAEKLPTVSAKPLVFPAPAPTAPLDPEIARLPNVEARRMSAFALKPGEVGPVAWLFSDVVCYPARLLRLVEEWLASGLCRNMVCTIKFQGAVDFETLRRFAAIPGARLFHLHHNKHELTFARLAEESAW